MAQLSAEEFISHVLIEKLDARKISIGENFNFGAKARGTPEMLKRVGSPTTEPMASTTRLGDWTASLLGVGRQRFVLLVAERSRSAQLGFDVATGVKFDNVKNRDRAQF